MADGHHLLGRRRRRPRSSAASAVGPGVELGVGQRARRRTSTAGRSGVAATWRSMRADQGVVGRRRRVGGGVEALDHLRPARRRRAGRRRRPAADGSAVTWSSRRDEPGAEPPRRWPGRTGRPRTPGPREALGRRTRRPPVEVEAGGALVVGHGPGVAERAVPAGRTVEVADHDLEQRVAGPRPGGVQRLDHGLERHVLVVEGGQVARPAPGRAARRRSGSPDRSVRSTRVLTKKPTRSSSASSVRPGHRRAHHDVVAGARAGAAGRRPPAWTAMNVLAPVAAHRSRRRPCTSAGTGTSTMPAAVAGHRRTGPVGGQRSAPRARRRAPRASRRAGGRGGWRGRRGRRARSRCHSV